MCQIFITPTKNDQFFWNNNEKNEQQIHRLKTIESENMWQISPPPPLPPPPDPFRYTRQFATSVCIKAICEIWLKLTIKIPKLRH